MEVKVKKVKVPKVKKVPKAKRLLTKLKKQKVKKLKVSVGERERKLMNKNIKKYKMNLLRNRNIMYQLKNLNSDVRLSFYDKKLHK